MSKSHKYDHIKNLPHHVSKKHPQLSRDSYAAQFSPFAALTGYEEIVAETARVTNEKMELDDDTKLRISNRLNVVFDHLDEEPVISITYFQPDKKKAGGEYVTVTGTVKTFDEIDRFILMTDGKKIPADDLFDVRGEIIDEYLPEDFWPGTTYCKKIRSETQNIVIS